MPDLDPRWAAVAEAVAAAAVHGPRVLAFEYAATAVGQPFDVARILLQVQWSPQRDAAAQLAQHADDAGEAMATGTAYRLLLPSPPPLSSPQPSPALVPVSARAHAPVQPAQLEEPQAEAHSPGPDPSIVERTRLSPRPPASKKLTDPDAEPGDPDAGAILASVWADVPNDASRYAPPPRPPTPSPELWPEAEADWASDGAPAPDEDGPQSSPELAPERPVAQSPLQPPPEIHEPVQQAASSPSPRQDSPLAPPPDSPFAQPLASPLVLPETKNPSPSPSVNIEVHATDSQEEGCCTLPIIYSGGLWDMTRAVVRGPEGWRALFKGTSTTFVLEALERILVPAHHQLLAAVAGLPSVASGLALAVRGGGGATVAAAALALAPSPWQAWGAAVVPHAVVRMALVPLDTLRTRTVAQLSIPGKRKYRAPWGTFPGLRVMADEEGGWARLWLAPHIFWPALLDCTVRPCILLLTPFVVDKLLPYDGAQPATTARVLLSLACQISALLVTLPIEAIRRRTQIQPRFDIAHHARVLAARREALPVAADESDQSDRSDLPTIKPGPIAGPGTGYLVRIKGLRTCVETRPLPYRGVMDALSRIVQEETSTPPWAVTDKNALMSTSGVYSLYRGFSIASMTLLAEAALALLLGEANSTGIWTEV